jgi:hypothetical protein
MGNLPGPWPLWGDLPINPTLRESKISARSTGGNAGRCHALLALLQRACIRVISVCPAFPAGGFASGVNLSCGALPSESNCVFSSQSVTPANGQPAQVKLTISTAASSADLRRSMNNLPGRHPWLPGGAIVSLAGLIGFLRNRAAGRRYHYSLRTMSLWIIACGVGVSLIGCGGSGSGNSTPTNPGTPAGTSNITISASVSGGNSTQTANIQLTIQ